MNRPSSSLSSSSFILLRVRGEGWLWIFIYVWFVFSTSSNAWWRRAFCSTKGLNTIEKNKSRGGEKIKRKGKVRMYALIRNAGTDKDDGSR